MADGGTEFITVFYTGQLMKFDMAVNALKEAGISHQVRAETATDLKVAMPVTPAPGPGRFFSLLVPSNVQVEAKRVLSELPFEITTNPGAWDFAPAPNVQRWLKICIIGGLALFVAFWIIQLMGLFR